MKKVIFVSLILLIYASSFAQSKKVLNAKIEALTLKIDVLSSKIDALIVLNNEQARVLEHLMPINTTKGIINAKEPGQAVSTGQCKAITKAGNRCSRNAQAGAEYCWQHNKTDESGSSEKKVSPSSSSPKYSGSPTIQTGPRGGKYYINSKGNKSYIRK